MNKLYEEDDIQAIANSIRAKNGSQDTYKLSEMADAINLLPVGIWQNPTVKVFLHDTNNVSYKTFTGTGTIPSGKDKAILVAFESTEQTSNINASAVSNCTVGTKTQQFSDTNRYGGDKAVRNALCTFPIEVTDTTQEAKVSVTINGNENRFAFAMLIY